MTASQLLLQFFLLLGAIPILVEALGNGNVNFEAGGVREPSYASNFTTAPVSRNFLRVLVDPEDANIEYISPRIDAKGRSIRVKDLLIDTYSIVAVHGLNPIDNEFHAEATWTAGDKLWLRDFLPKQLPNARILLFGYNSNVAFETSIAGVQDQASNLLNRLELKRDGLSDRPIIFLAHSLGGIVVKSALVEARLDSTYRAIPKATYGIAFFGTPHRGGNFAKLGDIAASIVRAVLRNPSNSFMEALKTDSLFSNTLIDQFKHQLEDYHVLSFYETLPMGKLGLIVDKKSATLGLAGTRERQIAMDAHHGNVCKFASADGDDYDQVSSNIVRLAKAAVTASESNEQSLPASKTTDPRLQRAFLVPYSRNPDFVGRQDTLTKLQKDLEMNGEHQKRAVLWGLGGVGKSQIAIQYVYWFRKTRQDVSVFWIHTSGMDRFQQGYREIAKDCNLPGIDDPTVDHLALVKSWLSSKESGKWLMVIDNVDEDDVFFGPPATGSKQKSTAINQYIPDCSNGAILMTTRNKALGQRFTRDRFLTEVAPMNGADSIELFRRHFSGKILPDDPVEELANELEGLPLALAQAAAFMQENSYSIREYLKLFKKSDDMMVKLLTQDFNPIGRDALLPNAVTTTWMVSFEHIKRTSPQAAEILSLTICLDRHDIPMLLMETNFEDDIESNRALGLLEAFSLISINRNNRAFTLHRLVHLAIRRWLKSQDQYEDRAVKCLKLVAEKFRSENLNNLESLDRADRFAPHAYSALSFAHFLPHSDSSAADLAGQVSTYLRGRGRYNDAALYAEQLLEWYERVLGEKDSQTMMAMNEVAVARIFQGKYREAEEILRRILNLNDRRWTNHVFITGFRTNLLQVLFDQAKYDEAENLARSIFEKYESDGKLGSPEAIGIMKKKAEILLGQNKFKEAELLLEEALELSKKLNGMEHRLTFSIMVSLANALSGQPTKRGKAEKLHRQTIELSNRLQGPDHPETLLAESNLAAHFLDVEELEEAKKIIPRVLAARERILGPNHPDTLTSLAMHAAYLGGHDQSEKNIQLIRRACTGLNDALGEKHPHTVRCLHVLHQVEESLK